MRSGSSAWLECLPVTQEVAGSSPVRSATISLTDLKVGFFVSGEMSFYSVPIPYLIVRLSPILLLKIVHEHASMIK